MLVRICPESRRNHRTAGWIREYSVCPEYPEAFGAKVYKIARDPQGNRLTYLKVTGGDLKVKETLPGIGGKVNQIRIYSGDKYELAQMHRQEWSVR